MAETGPAQEFCGVGESLSNDALGCRQGLDASTRSDPLFRVHSGSGEQRRIAP